MGEYLESDFALPASIVTNYDSVFHFFHSTDDRIVPISDFIKYKELFPKARFYQFENRGHFIGSEFPELFSIVSSFL